jgi:hypothetical protein
MLLWCTARCNQFECAQAGEALIPCCDCREESWDDLDEEAQPKAARVGAKRKASPNSSITSSTCTLEPCLELLPTLCPVQAPKPVTAGAEAQPQPAKQRRTKQAVDVHDLTLLGEGTCR